MQRVPPEPAKKATHPWRVGWLVDKEAQHEAERAKDRTFQARKRDAIAASKLNRTTP